MFIKAYDRSHNTDTPPLAHDLILALNISNIQSTIPEKHNTMMWMSRILMMLDY